MKRRIVIGLLALGTFVGYGSSLAHAIHHHHHAECAGREQETPSK